jgi:hypothetical protein
MTSGAMRESQQSRTSVIPEDVRLAHIVARVRRRRMCQGIFRRDMTAGRYAGGCSFLLFLDLLMGNSCLE